MDEITVYHADDGWRWTRRDGGNHEITGASTEAYVDPRGALKNIADTQGGEYKVINEEAQSGW